MKTWTYEQLKKVLDEFVGDDEPSDDKSKKRRRIIHFATELFLRHGYRRTSMSDVARRAGVAKGTLYLYFNTKADLLAHAIGVEKQRYAEALVPVINSEDPPRERLRQWLKLALMLSTKMPLVSRLLGPDRDMRVAAEEWMAVEDSGGGWATMRVEIIGQMIEQAAGPGVLTDEELADRAKVLFGLVYSGLVADEAVRAGLSLERYAGLLADMILDGVTFSMDSGAEDSNDDKEK